MLNEMTARHPHEEHWYLTILGTDPLHQGRGVGTALIEPMMERADDVGVPIYLETQKHSNLAYYGRFGFEVVDTFSVNDSPPIWQMQRRTALTTLGGSHSSCRTIAACPTPHDDSAASVPVRCCDGSSAAP